MAGPRTATSGATQRLFLKLEQIDDALKTSRTFTDFVGASKIIDNTSTTTYLANMVPLTGDTTWGGAPVIDTWGEWYGESTDRRDKSLVVGQSVEPIEFDLVMIRGDTMRKAVEDSDLGAACWWVLLRQEAAGHSTAGSNAAIDVGYGTISVAKNYNDKTSSKARVTLAPANLPKTIDA